VRRLVLLPLLALLWTSSGAAQPQPYLVKDINPSFEEQSSQPDRFVHFGRYAIFAATTLEEGRELRSSDGTPAGTFLLADVCPGACSSDPSPFAATPRGVFFSTPGSAGSTSGLWITRGTPATTMLLAEGVQATVGGTAVWMASQGVLYFSGFDSAHGSELWRSDGTPAGTYLVKDLWPGPPGTVGDLGGELTVYRGRVFFSASDGVTGWALWASDGTPAGTVLVKDPSPSTSINELGLRWLRATTGYLFFEANSPAGRELWRSDGTTAGTRLVADLTSGPGSSEIGNIVAAGNRVFLEMRAGSGLQGQEVWVSDGTARGTRQLTHFVEPLPFSHGTSSYGSLSAAAAIGNRLFFPARETGLGRELWTTDGTAKGTHLVADVCPGSCSGVGTVWPAFQNRIYFSPGDPSHGAGLWASDGTAAGTRLVRDLCPGLCNSFPGDPIPLGSVLLFTANADPAHNNRQVWKTDGTAAGTVQLSSFPGSNFVLNGQGLQGATTPGKLFFAADDGVHGLELWVSDGTAAGTRLAANIDGVDHGGSRPDGFMAAGGTLYFFADDGVHGSELWKSDGTAAGTELVHEFVPGPGALSRFRNVYARVDLGSTLLFTAALGLQSSVWRSDGTDAGTYALTPGDVQVDEYPSDAAFRAAGGKAFFQGRRPGSDYELWVSDGTLAGTRELDLVPGAHGSQPSSFTPFGDRMVFTANSSIFGDRRLWMSDGTDAGTAPVTDAVQPGGFLAVHQGLVYFLGTDASRSTQLWRSDGTAAGTVELPDLIPGRSLSAQLLTSLGSRLLLWDAFQGTPQAGLWVTDGTAAGTQQISSVHSLVTYPGPQELGGVVYFGGADGHSELLWRTDGTAAGTYPLRDRDGKTIARPDILTPFAGKLYFITPDVGATLWQSDGTPQGTFPLRQLEPGQSTSLALGVAGPRLFFRAYDPATGSELWAINGQ
jgi:ELWxxDGT repeat protein